MRRMWIVTMFALLLSFGVALKVKAQEVLVPAGTLLRCTVDEPNFSPATADIGDPILCHLSGVQEFGRVAFPRGSYLEGHLEAARQPGHFWGKGYLKLEFDRIGLPNTDLPVPSKVVALRSYHIDKEGDIDGKGHARRDAAEWLLPPLWPWKVLTLPLRGPEPALKGESQLTLRVMEDIVIPRSAMLQPGWHYFGESSALQPSSEAPPASSKDAAPLPQPAVAQPMQRSVEAPVSTQRVSDVAPERTDGSPRITLIALKSDQTYAVARYRIDRGQVNYVLASGAAGAIGVSDVDWIKTSQLNAQRTQAPTGVAVAQAR
jgi:hypothetical protein